VLWSEPLPNPATGAAPIVDGAGTAYVASDDGRVVAITRQVNAIGGRRLWLVCVHPLEQPRLATPALDGDGRVYIGAANN
jgi:hypothetical protein